MQKWIINVVPCPASTATPPYSEYSKTSLVWGHCMQVYSCAGILHQHVKQEITGVGKEKSHTTYCTALYKDILYCQCLCNTHTLYSKVLYSTAVL